MNNNVKLSEFTLTHSVHLHGFDTVAWAEYMVGQGADWSVELVVSSNLLRVVNNADGAVMYCAGFKYGKAVAGVPDTQAADAIPDATPKKGKYKRG